MPLCCTPSTSSVTPDTQLAREPLPLPRMRLNPERRALDEFVYEDFELVDYRHHPAIRAPVAV